ncbi:bacterial proteasome activator family protein [Nostocoides australiense]|nr:bacterial proteasome activator family protein [Actinomycetota bacterium]MCB1300888.1 bacterial proteasome activator family protein [Tetrasphaera sp.]HPF81439.1 bacterial proteasome activator family protein [Tetrasphaera australiensis]
MSEQQTAGRPGEAPAEQQNPDRVVVLTPEGMGVHDPSDEERNPSELVEQPAKVMRVASMIKQLLEEVRSSPLDDAGRARLAQIHQRSIAELKDGLAPELVQELDRLALPVGEGSTPSDAELRIAQAQLVGWLEGLFHGIQAALVAQQMAAQAQLQQMRRELPPGHPAAVPEQQPMPGPAARPGNPPFVVPSDGVGGTGQYL